MAAGPRPLAASRRGVALGTAFGFPIGVLSGFTGVGGGEYRAPVLVGLFGDVRHAIAANLLVGMAVSVATFLYRAGWTLAPDALVLAGLLVATSVPGGYLGAAATRRVSTRTLKALLAAILVVTGFRLILFETSATGAPALDLGSALLALALGFGLGLISGVLGLAAGEYRIPALILLFGIPPVAAGTLSSLAAIPQQAIAYATHRRLGHTAHATLRLGSAMAPASIVGVVLGVSLLGRTTEAVVARVLGGA
ncbi:MAG: TSUP family transporter, partial [Methanobacteriota archaeon]